MLKIQIKNRWTGIVLFEHKKEDNTIRDTLKEAIRQGANLREADLRGADLEGANLEGADLRGADLEGADLRGADLEGANLRGADLEGANLEGANLRGADLEEADLRGAYIYITDYEIDKENIIKKFEENANIKITESYVNKNIIPTRWSCFWNYGLIIREYEIAEKIEEMTLEEVCKELGRNIKIVETKEE